MQLIRILKQLDFQKPRNRAKRSRIKPSLHLWHRGENMGRIYDTALLSGHDWQLGNGKRMAPPLLGV